MLSRVQALDVGAVRLARRHGHTPAAERLVRTFSGLGEHAMVWLAIGAAGALLDEPRRPRWLRAAAAVTGAYVTNTAVKLIVGRPRPQLPDLPAVVGTPTQLSFPSAHATAGFAGALAYSRLGVAPGPLYGLAGALSLSRLYLGVHYPSDLLGGAALGSVIAAAVTPRAARTRGEQ